MLSLLHNEVVNKQYYRLYVINLVPSLKQLDFQKVTVKVGGCPTANFQERGSKEYRRRGTTASQ